MKRVGESRKKQGEKRKEEREGKECRSTMIDKNFTEGSK